MFLADSICFGCFFTVERRAMMMDLLQYLLFFFFSVISSSVLCGLDRNFNSNCPNIDYEMFLNWRVHPNVATFLCFLPVYILKNPHRICVYEQAV